MFSIKKIALVTGASSAIGASIAKRLADDGFFVVINYASSKEAAQSVAKYITQKGGSAMTYQADISDPESVWAMFESIEVSVGKIDVLINSAGIMEPKPLANADIRHVNKHIDINLKGTINVLREASNRLSNNGSIINISTSILGFMLENYGVYAATKSAVETLTAISAKELRGRNITVNAVAPGPTAKALCNKNKFEIHFENMLQSFPLEQFGVPENIASVVSFLVSADGGWINGQVLRVNGGIV